LYVIPQPGRWRPSEAGLDTRAQLEQRAKREHGARFDELMEEEDAEEDHSPGVS